MINGKSRHRRPDPLVLLVAAVLLCAIMTTAATGGGKFDSSPGPDAIYRTQSRDSGFTLASMGSEGGRLNVSLTPPTDLSHDFPTYQGSVPIRETLSQVFLFLRYPW